MWLPAHVRRRFWQDTLRTEDATVVVEYAFGRLVPIVYARGGKRYYPPSVAASAFMGPGALSQREWEMGLISAALGESALGATGQPAEDAVFQKSHPTLYAFMTLLEEDGVAREPSSLVIFTQDGQFKGCLTEKGPNLKLWRSADTFMKLLQSFEVALKSGSADWRRGFDPETSRKKPRGKK